jgi:GH24 family phage-related lysozyme (muramidase)
MEYHTKDYMTNINEFHLSEDSKICHLDFKPSEKFLSLGFEALIPFQTFFSQLYEKSHTLKAIYDINKEHFVKSISTSKYKQIGLGFIASLVISSMILPAHLTQQPIETNNVTPTATIKYHFLHSLFHSKIEAFTNLLSVTEGKSKKFYEDNDGIAVGYGWNPTKNTKEFNLQIAQAIGLNKKEQKAIESISSDHKTQHVPKSLKKITFSDKQLKIATTIMMSAYEKEFLNVMRIKATEKHLDFNMLHTKYNSLPNNQQAVLLHMTYKVGATRLLKYNDFFDKLFAYLQKPSELNLQSTAKSFEYSYKARDGERQHDTKVEQTHETFFNGSIKNEYTIGYNSPTDIQSNINKMRSQATNNTVRTTKSIT